MIQAFVGEPARAFFNAKNRMLKTEAYNMVKRLETM